MSHPGCITVVPARGFDTAKRRLAVLLPDQARRALAEALLVHTLGAVRAWGNGPVFVVTDSPDVAHTAAALGASSLVDPPGARLTFAVRAALDTLGGHLPRLVLMADLPWVTAEDLDALLGEGAALAPDHHRRGTNALYLPPGLKPRTFFGLPDSGRRHREALRDVPLRVVQRPGLARDLDTPADWMAWGAERSPALVRAAG
jgi:2-phospho-L-lactate guanylyltransferase